MYSSQYNPKEFYKKLASLVFPIALQTLMVAVVNASDALMLARLDQDSLSAVSLATQIAFISNSFILGLSAGLSVFAAQYWGKSDILSIEKIFGYVVKISSSIGFIISFMAFFFPEILMKLYTSDPNLIEKGSLYLKIASPTYLFAGMSQICLCILKNSDHAMKSTIISSTCVVLNIVLNAVLIYGLFFFPKMEIAGAALATTIARLVEVVWTFIEGLRKNRLKLRLKFLIHCDSILKKDFWKYSVPILFNFISWGAGFSMYSVIMGHLGSDAVAANSIANIVKNLACCLSSGIAAGSGIMIGNELGKNNFEKARIYGSKISLISILAGLVMGGLILLVTPFVLKNVSMSDDAVHYLKWMLVMCSYNLLGKSYNMIVNNGLFVAGGNTKFSMICDTIFMWGISVPLGCLAAFVFHAPVLLVFFIINIDEIIKMPAYFACYKKYRWLKNITR